MKRENGAEERGRGENQTKGTKKKLSSKNRDEIKRARKERKA